MQGPFQEVGNCTLASASVAKIKTLKKRKSKIENRNKRKRNGEKTERKGNNNRKR